MENDLKYKAPRILLLILEISYLIADWSGVYVYLVAPAGGDVVDGVPAATEEQQSVSKLRMKPTQRAWPSMDRFRWPSLSPESQSPPHCITMASGWNTSPAAQAATHM